MTKKQRQRRDIAAEVTAKLIEALEAGTNPWRRPWKTMCIRGGAMPHNGASGKAYRGINVLVLAMEQAAKGYTSAGWMTFKQAQDLGGNVRKGEKGTAVVFWKFLEKRTEGGNDDGSDKVTKFPMLRHYTVFNVDQIENLPERYAAPETPEPEEQPDLAGWVAEALNCSVQHGGDRACYIPSVDTIQMPNASQFDTGDYYASTLLHEATHATGSKHRLDRLTSARFGSKDYAFEELVADMGSSMLCMELGIDYDLPAHASYIESWLKVLKEDNKAILRAGSQAQKAFDYLMNAAEADEETEQVAEAA